MSREEWLIPPGPESRTGVPKPEWYDEPSDRWPVAAIQYHNLLAKGMEIAIKVQVVDTLVKMSSNNELPTDSWASINKALNERLKVDMSASRREAWNYLEPHERKMLVYWFAEAFNVDLLVHPGAKLEFRHPRVEPPRKKPKPR